MQGLPEPPAVFSTPLAKIENVSHGKTLWENVSYVPHSYIYDYEDLVLREGDILVALNRPITQNRLKIAKLRKSDVPSILYQRVGKIIYETHLVDEQFAYHFLTRAIYFFVVTGAIGSDQPYIALSDLYKIPLAVPPLEEQRKIAAILSTWDETIEQQTRLIELKRERKRGLMQQLLTGRVRFKEFEGLEWKTRALSKIVTDFIVPMRDKPKSLVGDIPWCRVEDFNGTYLTGSKSGQYVNKDTVKEMNLKVYPVGTLLVSCSANLGVCAITAVPLVTNQTFIGLVPDPQAADTLYLYYTMTNAAPALNRLSSGTTISYLSRRQFEDFTIKVPPLLEQQKIAAVLATADAELETLNAQLAALKKQKRGLMQRLLTGKTRVTLA